MHKSTNLQIKNKKLNKKFNLLKPMIGLYKIINKFFW